MMRFGFKVTVTEKSLLHTEIVPWWFRFYGKAFHDLGFRAYVFYPVPFNLFVNWGRSLWWKLLSPPPDAFECYCNKIYLDGFNAGRLIGRSEGLEIADPGDIMVKAKKILKDMEQL